MKAGKLGCNSKRKMGVSPSLNQPQQIAAEPCKQTAVHAARRLWLSKRGAPKRRFRVARYLSNPPLYNPCMKIENQFIQPAPIRVPDHQFTLPVHQAKPGPDNPLPIDDAIRIKAAEYWLKLGEADLALKELEALPTKIWKCGWALKTRIAAIGVLRERDELTVWA